MVSLQHAALLCTYKKQMLAVFSFKLTQEEKCLCVLKAILDESVYLNHYHH